MPTPFVSTVFVVLTTLNSAGQLSPVDRAELPAPYTGAMFWSEQQCMYVRGRMGHPEKYVCQIFRGPAETDWTYHPEGSFTGDPVAPSPSAPGAGQSPGPPLPDTRGDATQLPADGKAVATASLSRNDDIELAGGRYHYSKPLFLWVDGELPPEKVTGLPKQDPFADVSIGPSKLVENDRPTVTPLQQRPPKRAVAQRQTPTEAMYDANPFSLFAGLLTGNW
jgi:hypothetical protein